MTGYYLDIKLYREKGCKLCPRLLWATKLNNDQLTNEVSTLFPLPRLNANGYYDSLSIEECQTLLENGPSLKVKEELWILRRIRKAHKEDD